MYSVDVLIEFQDIIDISLMEKQGLWRALASGFARKSSMLPPLLRTLGRLGFMKQIDFIIYGIYRHDASGLNTT